MPNKHFVSNKDESPRMFQSDFIEALSKVHWTVPLFVYVPIIAYFLYIGFASATLSWHSNILLFLTGIIIWTLTEYLLHRFVFHFHPKSEFGQKLFWTFHGVHHDYPQDSKRLVMPPSVSLPLAALFFALFYYSLPGMTHATFFAGFLSGYLFYDISHYAIHHFAIRNKFFLRIKQHHMKHHYVEPEKGFGVSNPFWDNVFGTTFPEKTKQKN